MLREWRSHRRVNQQLVSIDKQLSKALSDGHSSTGDPFALLGKRKHYQSALDYLKTQQLLRKADRLSIDITPEQNPRWWYTQNEEGYPILTKSGQIRVKKLIDDERFARSERWIKLLAPIIAALTGLVGTIIGLLAFLWRNK
jgi:hypothetical protein